MKAVTQAHLHAPADLENAGAAEAPDSPWQPKTLLLQMMRWLVLQKRFGGGRGYGGQHSGFSSKDMVFLAEAVWQQGFAPFIASKTVDGVWGCLRVRTQARIEVPLAFVCCQSCCQQGFVPPYP